MVKWIVIIGFIWKGAVYSRVGHWRQLTCVYNAECRLNDSYSAYSDTFNVTTLDRKKIKPRQQQNKINYTKVRAHFSQKGFKMIKYHFQNNQFFFGLSRNSRYFFCEVCGDFFFRPHAKWSQMVLNLIEIAGFHLRKTSTLYDTKRESCAPYQCAELTATFCQELYLLAEGWHFMN